MNTIKSSLILSLTLLLTACGGGGDSGSGGTPIDNGSNGNGGSSVVPVPNINYVEADAKAAYTGRTQWAALNTTNAPAFVDLLFDRNGKSSPVNPYPYDLKSTDTNAPAVQDFLHSQEEVLRRTEQLLFPNAKFLARPVGFQSTQVCENNGTAQNLGYADDVNQRGKARVIYTNCLINGYILDGTAYTFLYKYNTAVDQPESILLSYDRMQITGTTNAYEITGTIHKVADFNNGSTRYITKLFRWNAAAQEQSLLNVVRYNFGDGYTQIRMNDADSASGIYDGIYGRVKVETKGELVYGNGGNTPTQGEILLTGMNSSKIYITALPTGLTINIDADGDGYYESQDMTY